MNLYDYQEKAVHDVRNEYRQGQKAPMFVLPTGGGKTITFAYIATQAALRGKRALILVHRVELLRQTQEKLSMFGVRVGLVSPKFTPDFHAPIQVAMVQTMVGRTRAYKHFDLIITDECHHVVASTYMNILSAYPNALNLGVTATPVRGDGRGLGVEAGGVYDSIVLGPSMEELISMGKLVRPKYALPPQPLELDKVKIERGDYSKKQLNELLNTKSVTGCAVEHYREKAHQMPGVAFCVSVEHAASVAANFRAAGYRAEHVHGGTPDSERDRILAGLGEGSVNVVTSVDVISEGTDIPAIYAAIMLRPTQSEGLWIQQAGRALRTVEGKDHALILDHVGNFWMHGPLEMERDWSLEGEKRTRRKKADENKLSVSLCESCYLAFPARLRTCPHCGHEKPVKARTVDQVDGELEELTAEQVAAVAAKKAKRQEVGRARTLDELHRIAAQRGYKQGWVYRQAQIKNIV